jgi:hypothetical protein
MLPNLFVIGAAKSGTTSLHHYLAQHPDVFMSPVKEPNFFAFQGELPTFAGPSRPPRDSFERDRLRRERYGYSIVRRPEYERLFTQAGGRKVRGEVSPAYLYFDGVARRIRDAVPTARILAVLRNPVDRAYSKFLQMRRDGAEPLDDFRAAVAAEPRRKRENWSPTWLYLDRGFYCRQLKVYFELFDRARIRVLLHDDLRRDPERCLSAIFTFVGVDPGAVIDRSEEHNASAVAHVPRSGWLYASVARPFLLSPYLQSVVPRPVAARVRPWARRLLLKQAASAAPSPLGPELRAMLTARFRDDVEQLQQLVNRDLSHWLEPRLSPSGLPDQEVDWSRRDDSSEGLPAAPGRTAVAGMAR